MPQSSLDGVQMIAGGIFGALNPNSKEADEHAKRYYAFIRSVNSDISKISSNADFDEKTIEEIKNYLFIDEHDLSGERKRFDSSYHIAQSWQRLWLGKNILPHDITLLNHEKYEMQLVKSGLSQAKAHIIASRKYNYSQEVEDYYATLN